MSLATVVVDEEGNVTVDGMTVARWLARERPQTMPIADSQSCDHARSDNPRFRNTCRKCGEVI